MRKRALFNRYVAAFTAAVFILTGTGPFSASVYSANSSVSKSLPENLQNAVLPEKLGKIKEAFQGTSGRSVILIQDAHAIPDAQRSIQKIIAHFQTQYGVELTAVEGASSALDAQIFRSFPDKERLKEVFDFYMDRGELTGPAAAAIFNRGKNAYRGIENWELYENGLRLYLDSLKKSPDISAKLNDIESNLQKEKEAVYSPRLLEADRQISGFYENEIEFAEVLKFLSSVKNPEKGTELAALIETIGADQKSLKDLEGEVKGAALKIQPVLEGKDLAAFNLKFQQFQTNAESLESFALYLREMAALHEIPLHLSSRLDLIMDRHRQVRDMEGQKVFKDFDVYAREVKSSLFENEIQRKLDQQTSRLILMKRLAKLELSHEQWSEFKNLKLDSALTGMFKSHLAFYDNAQKREDIFSKNLNALLSEDRQKSSLLVAGGFHAAGLIEKFKTEGISFLLITPHISEIPETIHYQDLMKGSVSWKEYFRIENGKINLYSAFVRAVRDRLLSEEVRPEITLKSWRDQMIRDLASQGRITDLARYASFIDEVPHQTKNNPEWFNKIQKFVEGLRGLDAKGEMTAPNILNLASPTALQAAGGNASVSRFGIISSELLFPSRSEVRSSGSEESKKKTTKGKKTPEKDKKKADGPEKKTTKKKKAPVKAVSPEQSVPAEAERELSEREREFLERAGRYARRKYAVKYGELPESDPLYVKAFEIFHETFGEDASKYRLVIAPGWVGMNALAIADGTIIVSAGLLEQIEYKEELQAVLSHEGVHIRRMHALARIELSERLESSSEDEISNWLSVFGISMVHEHEADIRWIIEEMKKRKINPHGQTVFMERLEGKNEKAAIGDSHAAAGQRALNSRLINYLIPMKTLTHDLTRLDEKFRNQAGALVKESMLRTSFESIPGYLDGDDRDRAREMRLRVAAEMPVSELGAAFKVVYQDFLEEQKKEKPKKARLRHSKEVLDILLNRMNAEIFTREKFPDRQTRRLVRLLYFEMMGIEYLLAEENEGLPELSGLQAEDSGEFPRDEFPAAVDRLISVMESSSMDLAPGFLASAGLRNFSEIIFQELLELAQTAEDVENNFIPAVRKWAAAAASFYERYGVSAMPEERVLRMAAEFLLKLEGTGKLNKAEIEAAQKILLPNFGPEKKQKQQRRPSDLSENALALDMVTQTHRLINSSNRQFDPTFVGNAARRLSAEFSGKTIMETFRFFTDLFHDNDYVSTVSRDEESGFGVNLTNALRNYTLWRICEQVLLNHEEYEKLSAAAQQALQFKVLLLLFTSDAGEKSADFAIDESGEMKFNPVTGAGESLFYLDELPETERQYVLTKNYLSIEDQWLAPDWDRKNLLEFFYYFNSFDKLLKPESTTKKHYGELFLRMLSRYLEKYQTWSSFWIEVEKLEKAGVPVKDILNGTDRKHFGKVLARLWENLPASPNEKQLDQILESVDFTENFSVRRLLYRYYTKKREELLGGTFETRLAGLLDDIGKGFASLDDLDVFIQGEVKTRAQFDLLNKKIADRLDLFLTKPDALTGAAGLIQNFGVSTDMSKRAFPALLESGQNDAALKRFLFSLPEKIDTAGAGIDDSEYLLNGLFSSLKARIDLAEKGESEVLRSSSLMKAALLRKMLTEKGGLIRDGDNRLVFLQDLIRGVMDSGDEGDRLVTVINEIIQAFSKVPAWQPLYFALEQVLIKKMANAPQKPSEWKEILTPDYLSDEFLSSDITQTQMGSLQLWIKNRRVRGYPLAELERIVKALENTPWRQEGVFMDLAETRLLDRLEREGITQSAVASGKLSPIEFIVEAAAHSGALPRRILQLLDQMLDLDEETREALSGVYDQFPGQWKSQAVAVVEGEWPQFWDSIEEVGDKVGGGSLATVFRIKAKEDSAFSKKDLVMKVLNVNHDFHDREVYEYMKSVANKLVALYGQKYGFLLDLVEQVHEWIQADVKFKGFLEQDKIFKQQNDGFTAPGFRYQMYVPESYGPSSEDFILEEYIEGARLTKPEELKAGGHDSKQIISLIAKNFIQQLMLGKVHSNIHPGNFKVMQDGRIAILDRNYFLTVTPQMQGVLMSMMAPGMFTPENLAQSMISLSANSSGVSAAQREKIGSVVSRYWPQIQNKDMDALRKMLVDLREAGLKLPIEIRLILLNFTTLEQMAKKIGGFEGGLIEALQYDPAAKKPKKSRSELRVFQSLTTEQGKRIVDAYIRYYKSPVAGTSRSEMDPIKRKAAEDLAGKIDALGRDWPVNENARLWTEGQTDEVAQKGRAVLMYERLRALGTIFNGITDQKQMETVSDAAFKLKVQLLELKPEEYRGWYLRAGEFISAVQAGEFYSLAPDYFLTSGVSIDQLEKKLRGELLSFSGTEEQAASQAIMNSEDLSEKEISAYNLNQHVPGWFHDGIGINGDLAIDGNHQDAQAKLKLLVAIMRSWEWLENNWMPLPRGALPASDLIRQMISRVDELDLNGLRLLVDAIAAIKETVSFKADSTVVLEDGQLVESSAIATLENGDFLTSRSDALRPLTVRGHAAGENLRSIELQPPDNVRDQYYGIVPRQIAILPEPNFLTFNVLERVIHIWNRENGEFVREISGNEPFADFRALPNGNIVTLRKSGSDYVSELWDSATGNNLHVLTLPQDQVADGFISNQLKIAEKRSLKGKNVILADGSILHVRWAQRPGTNEKDGIRRTVEIWNPETGARENEFELPFANIPNIIDVLLGDTLTAALLPNGTLAFATGSEPKHVIFILNPVSGRIFREINHDADFDAILALPNGYIATLDMDNKAQIWDPENMQTDLPLHTFEEGRIFWSQSLDATQPAPSSDGRVMSYSVEGEVGTLLWHFQHVMTARSEVRQEPSWILALTVSALFGIAISWVLFKDRIIKKWFSPATPIVQVMPQQPRQIDPEKLKNLDTLVPETAKLWGRHTDVQKRINVIMRELQPILDAKAEGDPVSKKERALRLKLAPLQEEIRRIDPPLKSAIEEIIKQDAAAAVPAIIRLSKEEELSARQTAVHLLSIFGGQPAFERLLEMTQDEDRSLRRLIFQSFNGFPEDPRALNALIMELRRSLSDAKEFNAEGSDLYRQSLISNLLRYREPAALEAFFWAWENEVSEENREIAQVDFISKFAGIPSAENIRRTLVARLKVINPQLKPELHALIESFEEAMDLPQRDEELNALRFMSKKLPPGAKKISDQGGYYLVSDVVRAGNKFTVLDWVVKSPQGIYSLVKLMEIEKGKGEFKTPLEDPAGDFLVFENPITRKIVIHRFDGAQMEISGDFNSARIEGDNLIYTQAGKEFRKHLPSQVFRFARSEVRLNKNWIAAFTVSAIIGLVVSWVLFKDRIAGMLFPAAPPIVEVVPQTPEQLAEAPVERPEQLAEPPVEQEKLEELIQQVDRLSRARLQGEFEVKLTRDQVKSSVENRLKIIEALGRDGADKMEKERRLSLERAQTNLKRAEQLLQEKTEKLIKQEDVFERLLEMLPATKPSLRLVIYRAFEKLPPDARVMNALIAASKKSVTDPKEFTDENSGEYRNRLFYLLSQYREPAALDHLLWAWENEHFDFNREDYSRIFIEQFSKLDSREEVLKKLVFMLKTVNPDLKPELHDFIDKFEEAIDLPQRDAELEALRVSKKLPVGAKKISGHEAGYYLVSEVVRGGNKFMIFVWVVEIPGGYKLVKLMEIEKGKGEFKTPLEDSAANFIVFENPLTKKIVIRRFDGAEMEISGDFNSARIEKDTLIYRDGKNEVSRHLPSLAFRFARSEMRANMSRRFFLGAGLTVVVGGVVTVGYLMNRQSAPEQTTPEQAPPVETPEVPFGIRAGVDEVIASILVGPDKKVNVAPIIKKEFLVVLRKAVAEIKDPGQGAEIYMDDIWNKLYPDKGLVDQIESSADYKEMWNALWVLIDFPKEILVPLDSGNRTVLVKIKWRKSLTERIIDFLKEIYISHPFPLSDVEAPLWIDLMPKLKAVKTKFINKEIDFDSFEKSLHDILNLVDGGIFTSVSRAYWHAAAAEELRDVYPDSAEFIKNILRARLGRFEKAVTAYEEGRISEEELEAGIKQSSVISEVTQGRLTDIESEQKYKMLPLESFFLFGAFPIPRDVYEGYMREMTQRFDALIKKRASELEEKFKRKLPAKDLSREAKQLAMLESMLTKWFASDAHIKGDRPYERLMVEKFDPLLTEVMSEIESAVEKPVSDVEWNEIMLRAEILFGLTVNDYILKKPYSQYAGRVNRLPVIKKVFKILHKKTTGLSDLGKVNAEELLKYVKMLLDFENIIPTNAFEEYVRQVEESDIQRGERVLKLTEEFIEELRISLLKKKKIGFEEWKEIRIKLDALIMLLDGNFPVNDPSSQIPVTRRELNAAALAPALNLIQDMLWNGYAAEAPSIHDYIRLGKIVQEYTNLRIRYLKVNRPVNVKGAEFEEVLKLKEKESGEFQTDFLMKAKSSEWWKRIWESTRKEFLHAEPSVVDNFVTALYAQPRVIYSGFAEDKPEKKIVYVHLKLDRLYEFYLNRMNEFKAGGDPESEMSMRLALLTINKLVDVINMQLKAEEKLDKDLSESLRLGFSKDIEKRMIDIGIVGRALPREAVPEFKELKKRSELRALDVDAVSEYIKYYAGELSHADLDVRIQAAIELAEVFEDIVEDLDSAEFFEKEKPALEAVIKFFQDTPRTGQQTEKLNRLFVDYLAFFALNLPSARDEVIKILSDNRTSNEDRSKIIVAIGSRQKDVDLSPLLTPSLLSALVPLLAGDDANLRDKVVYFLYKATHADFFSNRDSDNEGAIPPFSPEEERRLSELLNSIPGLVEGLISYLRRGVSFFNPHAGLILKFLNREPDGHRENWAESYRFIMRGVEKEIIFDKDQVVNDIAEHSITPPIEMLKKAFDPKDGAKRMVALVPSVLYALWEDNYGFINEINDLDITTVALPISAAFKDQLQRIRDGENLLLEAIEKFNRDKNPKRKMDDFLAEIISKFGLYYSLVREGGPIRGRDADFILEFEDWIASIDGRIEIFLYGEPLGKLPEVMTRNREARKLVPLLKDKKKKTLLFGDGQHISLRGPLIPSPEYSGDRTGASKLIEMLGAKESAALAFIALETHKHENEGLLRSDNFVQIYIDNPTSIPRKFGVFFKNGTILGNMHWYGYLNRLADVADGIIVNGEGENDADDFLEQPEPDGDHLKQPDEQLVTARSEMRSNQRFPASEQVIVMMRDDLLALGPAGGITQEEFNRRMEVLAPVIHFYLSGFHRSGREIIRMGSEIIFIAKQLFPEEAYRNTVNSVSEFSQEATPMTVKAFSSGRPEDLEFALRVIGNLGFEAWREGLDQSDDDWRRATKDSTALAKKILPYLTHQFPGVRLMAGFALGQLEGGEKLVVDSVNKLVSSDLVYRFQGLLDVKRAAAFREMSSSERASLVPILVRLVRRNATASLSHLTSDGYVRYLGLIGPEAVAALPLLIEMLSQEWIEAQAQFEEFQERVRRISAAIVGIGPIAFSHLSILMRLLNNPHDDTVLLLSIQALAGQRHAAVAAVPKLRELFNHENLNVRLEAARTLRFIGAGALSAVPDLTRMLTNENDEERTAAILTLEAIGQSVAGASAGILRTLRVGLENEESQDVRDIYLAAIRTLDTLEPLGLSDPVRKILTREGIITLDQLLALTQPELLEMKGMNKKRVQEIEAKVAESIAKPADARSEVRQLSRREVLRMAAAGLSALVIPEMTAGQEAAPVPEEIKGIAGELFTLTGEDPTNDPRFEEEVTKFLMSAREKALAGEKAVPVLSVSDLWKKIYAEQMKGANLETLAKLSWDAHKLANLPEEIILPLGKPGQQVIVKVVFDAGFVSQVTDFFENAYKSSRVSNLPEELPDNVYAKIFRLYLDDSKKLWAKLMPQIKKLKIDYKAGTINIAQLEESLNLIMAEADAYLVRYSGEQKRDFFHTAVEQQLREMSPNIENLTKDLLQARFARLRRLAEEYRRVNKEGEQDLQGHLWTEGGKDMVRAKRLDIQLPPRDRRIKPANYYLFGVLSVPQEVHLRQRNEYAKSLEGFFDSLTAELKSDIAKKISPEAIFRKVEKVLGLEFILESMHREDAIIFASVLKFSKKRIAEFDPIFSDFLAEFEGEIKSGKMTGGKWDAVRLMLESFRLLLYASEDKMKIIGVKAVNREAVFLQIAESMLAQMAKRLTAPEVVVKDLIFSASENKMFTDFSDYVFLVTDLKLSSKGLDAKRKKILAQAIESISAGKLLDGFKAGLSLEMKKRLIRELLIQPPYHFLAPDEKVPFQLNEYSHVSLDALFQYYLAQLYPYAYRDNKRGGAIVLDPLVYTDLKEYEAGNENRIKRGELEKIILNGDTEETVLALLDLSKVVDGVNADFQRSGDLIRLGFSKTILKQLTDKAGLKARDLPRDAILNESFLPVQQRSELRSNQRFPASEQVIVMMRDKLLSLGPVGKMTSEEFNQRMEVFAPVVHFYLNGFHRSGRQIIQMGSDIIFMAKQLFPEKEYETIVNSVAEFSQEAVPMALKAFSSGRSDDLEFALRIMGNLGFESFREGANLNDDEWREALKSSRDLAKKIMPYLTNLYPGVRLMAGFALGQLEGGEKLVIDSVNKRVPSEKVLSFMRSVGDIDILDITFTVSRYKEISLNETAALVPLLIRLLKSSGIISLQLEKICTVLGLIGPEAAAATPDLIRLLRSNLSANSVRTKIGIAIEKIGPIAYSNRSLLMESLNDPQDGNELRIKIRALAGQGRAAVIAVQRLRRLLRHQNENVRVEAARTLKAIGSGALSAVPDLTRMLGNPNQNDRIAAVLALETVGQSSVGASPDILRTLRAGLANEQDQEVRETYFAAIDTLDTLSPLQLSISVRNILTREGIITLDQLLALTPGELMEMRGMNRKRMREIEAKLEAKKNGDIKPEGARSELRTMSLGEKDRDGVYSLVEGDVVARKVVEAFRSGRILAAADVQGIAAVGGTIIPVIEAEAVLALQNDELTASLGYASIININEPTIVGWEFSEDAPDERLIASMTGAVRANRFISVRLMNVGKHAAKIQKLFNLSKQSSGDPVKLSMVSETGTDDLVIHHAEARVDGALTPGLVMRPGFVNAPGQRQLDSLEYANGIDRISKEDAWKVFPAGLLLLADPLSLKTSQIIKEGSTPERLSITSPAAFGVLQTIADLLSSAESRRAIASAA